MRRHLGQRLAADLDAPVLEPNHDVDLAPGVVGVRLILARVAAAALLALERGQRRALRDREQRVQIERGVPARVVLAVGGPPPPHPAAPLDGPRPWALLLDGPGFADAAPRPHRALSRRRDRIS